MKKLMFSILFSIFLCFPLSVFAEGYISVSPETLEIKKGETATFTITAYNSIGDVSIISSSTDIATVSSSEWSTGMVEEKQTKTETITITGVSAGTATITLSIDGATFDSEDLSGQEKTVVVTVKEDLTTQPSDDNSANKSDEKEETKTPDKITSNTTENPKTGIKTYTIFSVFIIALTIITYYILIKKNKINKI